jgi:hypothetical protein
MADLCGGIVEQTARAIARHDIIHSSELEYSDEYVSACVEETWRSYVPEVKAAISLRRRAWFRLSCAIGGIYEFGPLWIILHDDGLSIAWKQIEKFDWRA